MTQWPNGPISMTWFRKDNHPLEAPQEKRVQTEGLWTKCEACKHILWKKDLEANFLCCPKCGHHFKMGARLDEAREPYISVLTNPTTGGVTASFAMLGDLNIAEPGALIGFAGPRVIEQTIRQKLPEGFQSAEFLLSHGMLDAIVPRKEMKAYLAQALSFMGA